MPGRACRVASVISANTVAWPAVLFHRIGALSLAAALSLPDQREVSALRRGPGVKRAGICRQPAFTPWARYGSRRSVSIT